MRGLILTKGILLFIILLPFLTIAQLERNFQKVVLSGNKNVQSDLKFASDNSREINEDSVWMHYDDVVNYDSWGFLISGEIYDVVSKWDPSDLVNYDGWAVTKIKFYVVSNQPILKVKVWEGTDFTEIYSQDVNTYNVNAWTEVVLDSAVSIDITKELYVGYNVDMSAWELGGIVTAIDDGPAVDNYGNLCRLNGVWYSDFNNHNLRTLLEEVVEADFTSDVETVCEGSSINFTDISQGSPVSWNWSFEGGSPATSTLENPTVSYTNAGTYDVQLIITTTSGTVDTVFREDYVNVVILPVTPGIPSGETNMCAATYTDYTTNVVQYAESYEWSVTPADAGTINGTTNTETFFASETWSGDYTIKVRAINVCGNSEWSGELNCTLNAAPLEFNLSLGGESCEDGDGVEITLSGSETGVDYYLHHSGDTVAGPVAGTGNEISFGYFNEEGYYSATAFNGNCSSYMIGDAHITLSLLPLVAGTPSGPESVCSELMSEYSIEAVEGANSYVWTIIPEEAGTITGESLIGTVNWDSTYEGIAEIAARGENECGAGPSGPSLDVLVNSEPNPEINGDNLVCQLDYGTYSVQYSEYSEYQWTVDGGQITDGQGTNEITVYWTAEQGSLNTVDLTETKTEECQAIAESFEVTIDECLGIKNSDDNKLLIYPNPSKDKLTIEIEQISANLIDVQIMNLNGEYIFIKQDNALNDSYKNDYDISSLKSGIYMLIIKADDIILSHKKLVIIK